MHRIRRPRYQGMLVSIATFLLLGTLGCGGSRVYPVEGEVRFKDGQPLKGGQVIFELKTEEGEPNLSSSRGDIDDNGHFRLTTFKDGDGAMEGVNRVLIAPPKTGGDVEKPGSIPQIIHPRYRQFTTSGLEVTVTSDRKKNYFKFEIDRPPPKR